jgi:proteasome lid subunit RPN8/RPN11
VVIPADVRGAVAKHARAEAPNESCGLLALRDGVAERYYPGVNRSDSPYRFELDVDPEVWFLEDDGFQLAVVHSHVASPARPSRTDVENIGLWRARPYVIYSVADDELAAWRIDDRSVVPEPVTEARPAA